jgi:hypothetical protein
MEKPGIGIKEETRRKRTGHPTILKRHTVEISIKRNRRQFQADAGQFG